MINLELNCLLYQSALRYSLERTTLNLLLTEALIEIKV